MCSILYATVYASASFLWELNLALQPVWTFAERRPLRRSACPLTAGWGVVLTFVPRMRMVGAERDRERGGCRVQCTFGAILQ
jgi:hypothetical protein